uniref:Uncharacterized protein n=1 Tax=Oryza brachyantha TaxID=4533 RepID=J3LY68_ORYBR
RLSEKSMGEREEREKVNLVGSTSMRGVALSYVALAFSLESLLQRACIVDAFRLS